MKYFTFCVLCFFSCVTFADTTGLATSAVPTGIDIDRTGGFMLYGDFGNAGSCTTSNSIYVQSSHPQYNQIYSTALAAFMAGKKVYAYIQSCTSVGWYAGSSTTFNTLTPNSVFYIRN